jgi:hypothetical protein
MFFNRLNKFNLPNEQNVEIYYLLIVHKFLLIKYAHFQGRGHSVNIYCTVYENATLEYV